MADELLTPPQPSTTQTMLSPDGIPGEVPVERVQDALKAGFKMGVNMTAPSGQTGVIPIDRAESAVKAGFKTGAASSASRQMQTSALGYLAPRNPSDTSGTYQDVSQTPTSLPGVSEGPNLAKSLAGGGADEQSQGVDDIEQGNYAQGAHEIIGGLTSSPGAYAAAGLGAAAAPVATVTGLGGSVLSQALGKAAGKHLGLTESQSNLLGDIFSIAGGVGGAKLGGAISSSSLPELISDVPGRLSSAKTDIVDLKDALFDRNYADTATQEPATKVLRQAAQDASDDLSISNRISENPSIRTTLEEPISDSLDKAQQLFQKIDEASGTDFKALNDKLENTEYQIRQLTDTEEDMAKEAALEKSRTGLIDKIAQAKQQAIKNGVSPDVLDEADKMFTKAQALKELQAKVFKNTSVVEGNQASGSNETVNVNNAVKALQKLQDNNKYGTPRLEQALGKDGAADLLDNMYAAQRLGLKAVNKTTLAKSIVKNLWKPAAGLYGGYHILKDLI